MIFDILPVCDMFYVISTQVVRENENVTLGCDATGYPKPHIVWRREDGEDIVIGGKKVKN